ncbi:hypothetical protein DITRI_Ditri13aG0026800 [Diplodiscus trichospermus]
MHYLHAALAETLRLYPMIPVDGRCAKVDDILPDGHKVRRGDQAGPRICLSKEFAYRKMKISSIVLIHYFRFKLADDMKDATYKITTTLPMKGGLHLCVVPRTTLPTSQHEKSWNSSKVEFDLLF